MMTAYFGGLAELLGDGGVALIFMAGSLLVTLAVFIGCGILARRNLEKKGYYKPKLWLGYFAGTASSAVFCFYQAQRICGKGRILRNIDEK